jgi:hypothetical protein
MCNDKSISSCPSDSIKRVTYGRGFLYEWMVWKQSLLRLSFSCVIYEYIIYNTRFCVLECFSFKIMLFRLSLKNFAFIRHICLWFYSAVWLRFILSFIGLCTFVELNFRERKLLFHYFVLICFLSNCATYLRCSLSSLVLHDVLLLPGMLLHFKIELTFFFLYDKFVLQGTSLFVLVTKYWDSPVKETWGKWNIHHLWRMWEICKKICQKICRALRLVCGNAFGWGTALQAGRSKFEFPIGSLMALRPWGWFSLLTEMRTRNLSWG